MTPVASPAPSNTGSGFKPRFRGAQPNGGDVSDPRELAKELRGDEAIIRKHKDELPFWLDADRCRDAALICDAFAELPESTQRLAHAAATVRARLGEGWELKTRVITRWVRIESTRTSDDAWMDFFQTEQGWKWDTDNRGGECESLELALDAALAALAGDTGEHE